MRVFAFVLFWGLVTTCYALKVLTIEEPIIDAKPYWQSSSSTIDENESTPLEPLENFPFPVVSHLKAGKVERHTLPNNPFSHTLFVVGDDAFSHAWLKKHALKLQALQAIGFVTNVADAKAFEGVRVLAGLPLQPIDITALAQNLSIRHYPFVIEAGVIWQ